MIRSSLYVLGGVVAGVALTENKEMVSDVVYSAGGFLKSFATELRNVKIQGTPLGEVPVLSQTLAVLSGMKVERSSVQTGVNRASGLVKDVVGKSDQSGVSQGSGKVSYLTLGLFVAVPASIYLYVDPTARDSARTMSLKAYDKACSGVKVMSKAWQDKEQRDKLWSRVVNDVKEVKDKAGVYLKEQYNIIEHVVKEKIASLQKPGAPAIA